jgi:hypothetical protein
MGEADEKEANAARRKKQELLEQSAPSGHSPKPANSEGSTPTVHKMGTTSAIMRSTARRDFAI